jgi:hypothetical protein
MELIAQKPCSFGGRKFFVGEIIPEEMVLDPKAQEKMGVLVIASADSAESVNELHEIVTQVANVKFEIKIHTKEDDLSVQVTNDELSVFTDILQIGTGKVEDKQKISEMIHEVESEDLLILIDALDGRKYVKELALERAQQLTEKLKEKAPFEDVDGDE